MWIILCIADISHINWWVMILILYYILTNTTTSTPAVTNSLSLSLSSLNVPTAAPTEISLKDQLTTEYY